MPSLSVEERNRLLGQYQAGVSPTKLSKIFKVSTHAVYKILKKSKQENSLKNKHRSGRPKAPMHRRMLTLSKFLELIPLRP